tara:strand:- start:1105 stop:1326 length:222 start_codon:yes stop_codon:yes gene_type:complete
MRPVDNPNVSLASADCWRFTVCSDLQNTTYYIYAETKEGGLKYLSEETYADYLGNVGSDRITYIRPPIGNKEE